MSGGRFGPGADVAALARVFRFGGRVFVTRFTIQGAILRTLAPDPALLAAPQTLYIVMVAQQYQARQHGNWEGELRFEPPDVKRRDQRADNRTQGRVAAEQHR